MKSKITGHVFMAMSLDGFVARKDNNLDWLMKYDTEGENTGYDGFVENIDVIVMGSGSFKNVLSFGGEWPYKNPVMVMSHSMTTENIPEKLRTIVEITTLAPKELMDSLSEKKFERAYIDGGLVVQSFIRAGLIKDIVVTVIPILLGSGKRLFGEIETDIDLKLCSSQTFNCGFVQTHYQLLKKTKS
jgi:dihydrofolate reductase